MKIIHLDLSGPYTENTNYQVNMLSKCNSMNNEVTLIVTCERWNKNGQIETVQESDTINEDNIRIIRKNYKKIINYNISRKIRKIKNLYNILVDIKPDIIFMHCLQSYEIINLIKYKKNRNYIKIIGDFHSNYKNSAKNLISSILLHKIFYKYLIKKYSIYFDKIYAIGEMEKEFVTNMYKLNKNNIEILNLGGIIQNANLINSDKSKIRNSYNISQEEIVFTVAGKFNKEKNLDKLIEIFINNYNAKFRLIIVGSLSEEIKNSVHNLINKDQRIIYVDFVEYSNLKSILNASDVYIQLMQVSSIVQEALCSGLIMVLPNNNTYKDIIKTENINGFLINDIDQINDVIKTISNMDSNAIQNMKNKSMEIGKSFYNYETISEKYL